jgi:hypothetical protein
MPHSCDKLPDLLTTRVATPFPVSRSGSFSVTEFVPTVRRSVYLTWLFLVFQPIVQLR